MIKKTDIIIGENGEPIDLLEERNNQIRANTKKAFDMLLEEKNTMIAMKKQPKLGYRFMKQLLPELAKIPLMSDDEFVQLTAEEINHYYVKFLELSAYFNMYFELVDNANLFRRYMGLDPERFKSLLEHEDEGIRRTLAMLDNDYVGMGWLGGESGEANVNATIKRLSASGNAGHSVTSATEERMISTVTQMTHAEADRQLAALGIRPLIEGK